MTKLLHCPLTCRCQGTAIIRVHPDLLPLRVLRNPMPWFPVTTIIKWNNSLYSSRYLFQTSNERIQSENSWDKDTYMYEIIREQDYTKDIIFKNILRIGNMRSIECSSSTCFTLLLCWDSKTTGDSPCLMRIILLY